MNRTDLIPTLTAALLLAASLSPVHAASLIRDGDFDSLPVGTAPDSGKPAGSWFWPASYSSYPSTGENYTEPAASQMSIASAPAGGTGNALRLSFGATENLGRPTFLPNVFARRVNNTSGERLHVSFDLYVAPGRGGGAVLLGYGPIFNTHDPALNERGPQLIWEPSGRLSAWAAWHISETPIALSASYPRGVWQTVRLEVDMARQRYNFFSGEKGQPVSLTRTNIAFFAGTLPYIDRLMIVRWSHSEASSGSLADNQSYFDNFRLTTDPVITPVAADLAAGETTTLQVVNLPAGDATFQWQRNGQDIAGATAATLELSNATAELAGNYTVVVTRLGQSVTTEASTVRVFDKLTITTPPEKIEALSGKTTGFSVAAAGPLPMTYQWRFNGADLPNKTNRFLTFPAKTDTAGDYSVVVSDATGSVVSDPAKLAVLVPPTFVQAPLAMKGVAGSSVTISAAVTGTGPFTYQWRKGSAFDSSTVRSTVKSAETNAFFTLSNVQVSQGGAYRLYLGNAAVPDISSTSPNRSFTLTVLPDTDGDGLPDEWETANGFNAADGSDAAQDKDGDGINNLAEYHSGTVPTDAASALRLATVADTEGRASVNFTAAANRTYTVEWNASVAGGSWQKLTDIVAKSADRLETVTDASNGEGARFYRVVTPRRP
jgi:hypothetical protein